MSRLLPKTIFTICILYLAASIAQAQHTRITQVDTSKFPKVRVYLSVTDKDGNPISDDKAVTLELYEDGSLVSKSVLSQGGQVYSVLVLDLSESMKEDEKLAKAKAAAINYINMAPANFEIAIVRFADHEDVSTVIGFTTNKIALRSSVQGLETMGRTALQDGIGKGLDLLRGKKGRKVVTLLTDGWENASSDYQGESGNMRLINRGVKEECTISVIGLGSNVQTDYLKSYERTGGIYLPSPTASQLHDVFGKAVKLLEKERVIEYVTGSADPDGTRGHLTAKLWFGRDVYESPQTQYVKPGLLPHVRGNHVPFEIAIVLLLIAPSILTVVGALLSIHRFRTKHVKRLEPGSIFLSRRDLNYPPSQGGFKVGDLIVICPLSNTPYYVRSWRMLKCHCMRENPEFCSGKFCYHYNFPKWVRQWLDRISGEREGKEGRTWLCRCAGDKAGY